MSEQKKPSASAVRAAGRILDDVLDHHTIKNAFRSCSTEVVENDIVPRWESIIDAEIQPLIGALSGLLYCQRGCWYLRTDEDLIDQAAIMLTRARGAA